MYATFMPKPAAGIQGSGMHTHFRLTEDGRNAFADGGVLSKVGRSFVAGLLEHAPAITAVANQWVNSYKRLVPGYEAPVYVCWAHRNRSALVRIPADRPKDERACRIEYRAIDPACNPYLAFVAVLAAGLDGIRRGLEPPVHLHLRPRAQYGHRAAAFQCAPIPSSPLVPPIIGGAERNGRAASFEVQGAGVGGTTPSRSRMLSWSRSVGW